MKKLRICAAVLAAVLVTGAMPAGILSQNNTDYITASAEEGTQGVSDGLKYTLYEDYVKITGYDGDIENGKLVIPSEIGGLPVTSVGDYAFNGNKQLVSLVLPDTITELGIFSFFDCTNLEEVSFPETLTNFGDGPFFNSIWMENKKLESQIVVLNHVAVNGQGKTCTGDIVIPEGVIKIGSSCFHKNSNITSVTIPDTVTEIESWAFENCTQLAQIVLPDSVTKIGQRAFNNCKNLTTVAIPGLEYMESGAFKECTSLKDLTIPGKFETPTISSYTENFFYHCPIETLTIADGSTEIQDNFVSFGWINDTLKTVTIPETVTKIGKAAFVNCKSLTQVVIPDTVTEIGESAFKYCSSLSEVNLPPKLTSLESGVFWNCTSLAEIEIPAHVKNIDYRAFYDCISLKTITIPASVEVIDGDAFGYCKSLESFTLLNPECQLLNGKNSGSEEEETIWRYYDEEDNLELPIYTKNAGGIFDVQLSCDAVLYGYPDSTLQAYAEKYKFPFTALEGEPPTETDTAVTLGDVDESGEIDVLDVITLNKAVLGKEKLTDSQNKAADVNKSGKPDSGDSLMILKHIVGLLDSFE